MATTKYKNFKIFFLICMLALLLIVVNGCSKFTFIEKGTIEETKNAVKDSLKDLKEAALSLKYITWSEKIVSIPKNSYYIIYSDYSTSVSGYNKKILCSFTSDKPIDIYAIPYGMLENAKSGGNISMYPACSSEKTLNLKCSDSCSVPLDTTYFIRNNNADWDVNVDIKLQYLVSNLAAS